MILSYKISAELSAGYLKNAEIEEADMATTIVRQAVTHQGQVWLDTTKTGRNYRIFSAGNASPVVLTIALGGVTVVALQSKVEVIVDGHTIPDGVVDEPAGCGTRTFRIEEAKTIDLKIVEPASHAQVGYTISVLN